MKQNLFKSKTAAIVALFSMAFTLPQTIQAEEYKLAIAGKMITSENCNDLSVIEGVTGKASYDPATNTLTLENVTIQSTEICNGIDNGIDGTTIKLIGNNTITVDKNTGILNYVDMHLTITGNGSIKVNGIPEAEASIGIQNRGYLTVKDCNIEATGGYTGIASGEWTFDNCTVRAKGNGTIFNEYAGSVCWLWNNKPVFKNCSITEPEGAYWKEIKDDGGGVNYSLFGADDKVITDWVTIAPNEQTGINATATNVPAKKQGVYNLQGVYLGTSSEHLPTGIYIVDGKKVVKE